MKVDLCGLLLVLFIGLKLTGYIAWSWWWVLSPLWIPFAVAAAILAVVAIMSGFTEMHALLIEAIEKKSR